MNRNFPNWHICIVLGTEVLPEAILIVGGESQHVHSISTSEIVYLDGDRSSIEECRRPKRMDRGFYGMAGHFDGVGLKVVLCGGVSYSYLPDADSVNANDCFEYSLITDHWTKPYSMVTQRQLPVSVFLNNGSFFILGGESNPDMQSTEYPIEGLEGPRTPFNDLDHSYCACVINDTHILMAGGTISGRLAYMLDLISEEWIQIPDMLNDRYGHICKHIKQDTEVLVIGGHMKSTVEIFSLEIWAWRMVQPLPKDIGYAAIVDYGNNFLLVGGWDGQHDDINSLSLRREDTIYEFNPTDYSWGERREKLEYGKSRFVAFPLMPGWRDKARVCW